MAIKENELPVVEGLNDGDKVRIVTAEGASKQIDSDVIGVVVVTLTGTSDETFAIDKSYQNIQETALSSERILVKWDATNGMGAAIVFFQLGNVNTDNYVEFYNTNSNVITTLRVRRNGSITMSRKTLS